MRRSLTIEVFHAGGWHRAARVEASGAVMRGEPTWLEYDYDYAGVHLGHRDRRALSSRFPVNYELHSLATLPAFACDMMPQGEARRVLEAGLRNEGEIPSDWAVLERGAYCPVGNLRIARSVVALPPGPGFSRADVIERGDSFREWAEVEGIPMTGSSDTGGASPKLLLTEDVAGSLHADGVLPDARASKHYLVKFARGRSRRDAQVLAHEPAYLELARRFGVRCGQPLVHEDGALFVPRFDREVTGSAGEPVRRSGLESLYSIMGIVEPGAPLKWEKACEAIAAVVDDPVDALLEIVRRDALALAFGDTDNHGRNTSIIKHAAGGVALSPRYDFAPMFLDPELIKRSTRWRSEQPGRPPDFSDVADSLTRFVERGRVIETLHSLSEQLAEAPDLMRELAVDTEIIERREPHIREVARALGKAN